MNINNSIIESIHTDHCRLAWGGNTDISAYYNISCPFIPDMVEISIVVMNTVATNVYYLESDIIPVYPVAIANHGNYYNGITTYMNQSRRSFQGSYSARLYKLADQTPGNAIQILLIAKFTRFKSEC